MLNYDTTKIVTDDDDKDDALKVSMAQSEAIIIPVKNGKLYLIITCRKFKKINHYANNYIDQETQLC